MTVRELTEALSLTPFHLAQPDRPVSGGYAGDLLSWVLGRAGQDAAWLTIMSNQNVAAVALMAEVSCAILTRRRPAPPRSGEGRQSAGGRTGYL